MYNFNVPLVVFGCSWAVGIGVEYPDTFGYKLSRKLGSSTYTNMGIQGSSNSRSVLQLLEYIKRTDIELLNSVAVFLITTPARDCTIVFKENSPYSIQDLHSSKSTIESQCYVSYFSSEPNLNFNFHKNLLSMQSICRAYGIKDYYIDAWSNSNFDLPGVDTSKIFSKSCIELFDFQNTRHYLDTYPNRYTRICGHPSEQGHQLIADTLHEWLITTNNQL